jgi:glycosidase
VKQAYIAILFTAFTTFNIMAEESFLTRIEPANWWVGLKNPHVQLLVYGKNLKNAKINGAYQGIILESVERSDNPNYIFINLIINKDAKPGKINLSLINTDNKEILTSYAILERQKHIGGKSGFSPADAIYLITPDRFANGNPNNDSIQGYADKANRKKPDSRHGGDIKGISDHIDYIKNLGFTAIWINPLLENNMPEGSYHGYAITDYYKIDPRHGSNDDYCRLVDKCHTNGIKVIMDFVLNHCGSHHWWANDLPSKDWYHQFDEFTQTNYRIATLVDPHASDYDKLIFEKGWFVPSMPDLNQDNKFVATYLIQNAIWWIETANIDGIRLDTQPYSEMNFLNNWLQSINTEYPDFTVVGESWYHTEAITAAYQKSAKPLTPYKSEMQFVTDFPLCFSINSILNDDGNSGLDRVYNVLAQDFLYGNPMHTMIFLDNHDLSRIYETTKDSVRKYKMLVGMLATLRGMPQFYYGAEIMMPGDKSKGDGSLRKDMPGGWLGDSANAFTGFNLKPNQIEAQEYTRKLFNWRKSNKIAQDGAFKHFIPVDGLYVYTRYNNAETVLVLVNNNERKVVKPDWKRYAELIKGFSKAKNAMTDEVYEFGNISVPGKTTLIFELQ